MLVLPMGSVGRPQGPGLSRLLYRNTRFVLVRILGAIHRLRGVSG